MAEPTARLEVEISFPTTETALAAALLEASEFKPEPFEYAGFDGSGESYTLLLTISSIAVSLFIRILKQQTAQRKNVEIKAKGISIKGAPPERIEAILTQLLAAQNTSRHE